MCHHLATNILAASVLIASSGFDVPVVAKIEARRAARTLGVARPEVLHR